MMTQKVSVLLRFYWGIYYGVSGAFLFGLLAGIAGHSLGLHSEVRVGLLMVGAALGFIVGIRYRYRRISKNPISQAIMAIVFLTIGGLSLLIGARGLMSRQVNRIVSGRGPLGPITLSWTEDPGLFWLYVFYWVISGIFCLGLGACDLVEALGSNPCTLPGAGMFQSVHAKWERLPDIVQIIIIVAMAFSPLMYFVVLRLITSPLAR